MTVKRLLWITAVMLLLFLERYTLGTYQRYQHLFFKDLINLTIQVHIIICEEGCCCVVFLICGFSTSVISHSF